MHYNGAKSAAVAFKNLCDEQEATIQGLKQQLREMQLSSAFPAPQTISLSNRVVDLDDLQSSRLERRSLKRSIDPAELALDSRRVRPFTQAYSRIQELDDSPNSVHRQSGYQIGNRNMAPLSTLAYTSSFSPSEDLGFSPAFSTPFRRSDISPKRKSSFSKGPMRSQGDGNSLRISSTRPDRHHSRVIARTTLGTRTNGLRGPRLRSIGNG